MVGTTYGLCIPPPRVYTIMSAHDSLPISLSIHYKKYFPKVKVFAVQDDVSIKSLIDSCLQHLTVYLLETDEKVLQKLDTAPYQPIKYALAYMKPGTTNVWVELVDDREFLNFSHLMDLFEDPAEETNCLQVLATVYKEDAALKNGPQYLYITPREDEERQEFWRLGQSAMIQEATLASEPPSRVPGSSAQIAKPPGSISAYFALLAFRIRDKKLSNPIRAFSVPTYEIGNLLIAGTTSDYWLEPDESQAEDYDFIAEFGTYKPKLKLRGAPFDHLDKKGGACVADEASASVPQLPPLSMSVFTAKQPCVSTATVSEQKLSIAVRCILKVELGLREDEVMVFPPSIILNINPQATADKVRDEIKERLESAPDFRAGSESHEYRPVSPSILFTSDNTALWSTSLWVLPQSPVVQKMYQWARRDGVEQPTLLTDFLDNECVENGDLSLYMEAYIVPAKDDFVFSGKRLAFKDAPPFTSEELEPDEDEISEARGILTVTESEIDEVEAEMAREASEKALPDPPYTGKGKGKAMEVPPKRSGSTKSAGSPRVESGQGSRRGRPGKFRRRRDSKDERVQEAIRISAQMAQPARTEPRGPAHSASMDAADL